MDVCSLISGLPLLDHLAAPTIHFSGGSNLPRQIVASKRLRIDFLHFRLANTAHVQFLALLDLRNFPSFTELHLSFPPHALSWLTPRSHQFDIGLVLRTSQDTLKALELDTEAFGLRPRTPNRYPPLLLDRAISTLTHLTKLELSPHLVRMTHVFDTLAPLHRLEHFALTDEMEEGNTELWAQATIEYLKNAPSLKYTLLPVGIEEYWSSVEIGDVKAAASELGIEREFGRWSPRASDHADLAPRLTQWTFGIYLMRNPQLSRV